MALSLHARCSDLKEPAVRILPNLCSFFSPMVDVWHLVFSDWLTWVIWTFDVLQVLVVQTPRPARHARGWTSPVKSPPVWGLGVLGHQALFLGSGER